jgi:hypothetical protein
MIRPLFSVLSDLIVLAEGVITRPQSVSAVTNRFAMVAAEVRRADAAPAEDVRTTRAAAVMVIAIEEFLGDQDGGGVASPWLMIVGAMLPMLRSEAYTALRQQREQAR